MSEHAVGERLKNLFESMNATISVDATFSSAYNLDFTLTRLREVHAHVNLGIHVTTTREDTDELTKFAQAARRGVVLKSIYIEISEDAVETGGLLVSVGACISFLFDRRFAQHRSVGVRIHEDCSFQFFEVEEAIQRLERKYVDDDLAIGDDLRGRIIAYFTDKGFGFVQTDDDRKFFFHIANVVDDHLRARLPAYVLGEIIPVDFQYGGNDGKKYPKAINVSLDEAEYDYDSDGY
ncbi:MAG: hypothetical protein R3E66_03730 [bacterium]